MKRKPSKTLTCRNSQLLPPMESTSFVLSSYFGTPKPETFIGKEISRVILLVYSYGLFASLLSILSSRTSLCWLLLTSSAKIVHSYLSWSTHMLMPSSDLCFSHWSCARSNLSGGDTWVWLRDPYLWYSLSSSMSSTSHGWVIDYLQGRSKEWKTFQISTTRFSTCSCYWPHQTTPMSCYLAIIKSAGMPSSSFYSW